MKLYFLVTINVALICTHINLQARGWGVDAGAYYQNVDIHHHEDRIKCGICESSVSRHALQNFQLPHHTGAQLRVCARCATDLAREIGAHATQAESAQVIARLQQSHADRQAQTDKMIFKAFGCVTLGTFIYYVAESDLLRVNEKINNWWQQLPEERKNLVKRLAKIGSIGGASYLLYRLIRA